MKVVIFVYALIVLNLLLLYYYDIFLINKNRARLVVVTCDTAETIAKKAKTLKDVNFQKVNSSSHYVCNWPDFSNKPYEKFKKFYNITPAITFIPERTDLHLQEFIDGGKNVRGIVGGFKTYKSMLLNSTIKLKGSSIKDIEWMLGPGNLGTIVKVPFNSNFLKRTKSSLDAPNILYLLLDSVSYPQFRREMPALNDLLSHASKYGMKHVSFSRCQHVGGGSPHNKVPMHTGRHYYEFTTHINKPNFAGKIFPPGGLAKTYTEWTYQVAARNGYVTSHSEGICSFGDSPSNYTAGAIEKYFPGNKFLYDHKFPAVLFCKTEIPNLVNASLCCLSKNGCKIMKDPFEHINTCLGGDWNHGRALEWILDVSKVYNQHGLRTFQDYTILDPHDPMMRGERFNDLPLTNFFKKQMESGRLKNHIVVIVSDHGNGGPFMLDTQGTLELRNTMLEFLLPQNWVNKNRKAVENLKANSRTLSSVLDIYETLRHFMEANTYKHRPQSLGTSLLTPLPPNRTCKHANLPDEICLCAKRAQYVSISATDRAVTSLMNFVIKDMNKRVHAWNKIAGLKVCHPFKFDRLKVAKRKLVIHVAEYQVKFTALSKRPVPIEFYAEVGYHGGTRQFKLRRLVQFSQFAPYVAKCRSYSHKFSIDLHGCDCNL